MTSPTTARPQPTAQSFDSILQNALDELAAEQTQHKRKRVHRLVREYAWTKHMIESNGMAIRKKDKDASPKGCSASTQMNAWPPMSNWTPLENRSGTGDA